MKASECIERLARFIKNYGDLEVKFESLTGTQPHSKFLNFKVRPDSHVVFVLVRDDFLTMDFKEGDKIEL